MKDSLYQCAFGVELGGPASIQNYLNMKSENGFELVFAEHVVEGVWNFIFRYESDTQR